MVSSKCTLIDQAWTADAAALDRVQARHLMGMHELGPITGPQMQDISTKVKAALTALVPAESITLD